VSFPSSDGIVPEKEFERVSVTKPRYISVSAVSLPSHVGMVPDMRLPSRSSAVKVDINPTSLGMAPVNKLSYKYIPVRDFIFEMAVGMVPLRELENKFRVNMKLRRPNSLGMDPVNPLLARSKI